jgi:hypothetical protein
MKSRTKVIEIHLDDVLRKATALDTQQAYKKLPRQGG